MAVVPGAVLSGKLQEELFQEAVQKADVLRVPMLPALLPGLRLRQQLVLLDAVLLLLAGVRLLRFFLQEEAQLQAFQETASPVRLLVPNRLR
jgi:hypothetical protein